jgi:bifunctional polynucleotide phosphatase/kinase
MERFFNRVGSSSAAVVRVRFKGVALPAGWSVHANTVLVFQRGTADPSLARSALFDFDGTLAPRGARDGSTPLTFPRDLMFPTVPSALQRLHDARYRLVIVTNEANIGRFKTPDVVRRAIESKIARLTALLDHVGDELPLLVLVATAKDEYRKGEGEGLWRCVADLSKSSVPLDVAGSMMCGDAAGRPRDFSDSDRAFADAVGLPFFTPEQLFGADATALDRLVVAESGCGCGGADGAAAKAEGGAPPDAAPAAKRQRVDAGKT